MDAKDYGFNEGFFLQEGAEAPSNYTTIGNIESQSLVVPTSILDEEYSNYSAIVGTPAAKTPEEFHTAYGNAKLLQNTLGLKKVPGDNTVSVGVDFRGDPIYSENNLANDQNVEKGKSLAVTAGMSLGAMNAFKDFKEAQRFMQISEKSSNPAVLETLDKHKSNGDVKAFVNEVAPDKTLTEFAGYKLFENWNNLSPAQKSLGVATIGVQGFRFDNGQSFKEKRLTPEIPGVPSMNAAEGLSLASKGVNVSPVTKKWNQYSTIQETMYTPKSAVDVATTANAGGLIGYGMEGNAVPIDDKAMAIAKMEPTPQYGIGAAMVPIGNGIPSGYRVLKNYNGKSIIIPEDNIGSAHVNTPDVATKAAADIYNKWKGEKRTQTQGIKGGSALAGGLSKMAASNPYSLGAVMTYANLQRVGDLKQTDLGHVSHMIGVSLERLSTGDTVNDYKGKDYSIEGDLSEKEYYSAMKQLRGEFAKRGISSKEIGYQLANQGYAENRFDESEVTAMHRTIDMVFDGNSYTLAQKLNTGKNKGLELVEKRRRG